MFFENWKKNISGSPALPPSLEFFNYAQEFPQQNLSSKSAFAKAATRKLSYTKLGLDSRRGSNASTSSGDRRESEYGTKLVSFSLR